MEDLINLSLFNSFTTYDSVPEAVLSHYDTQLASSGAYDDALWGVLANFRECDYLAFRGQSTSTCMVSHSHIDHVEHMITVFDLPGSRY